MDKNQKPAAEQQMEDAYKCYHIAYDWLMGDLTEDEAREQLSDTLDGSEALEWWGEKVLSCH